MVTKMDNQSLLRTVRRAVFGAVVVLLATWLGCSTTTRIDAGHVGVKVKLAGSERGVQDTPLTAG